MLKNIFTSLKLGSLTPSNRVCLLAHRTNFASGGVLNDRLIAYYRRRARGGCGMIIVGELAIHPNDRPWENMIETYHPRAIDTFQRLTDAVHEFDTCVLAQLNHHGFQSSGHITRREIWGPSAVADIVFGETCKPMEPEDIEALVNAFAEAAVVVQKGGFDGLEIDMGPESLIRQFLSCISNHRQDQYGGDLENRMRLALEIVRAVRNAVGDDFTMGVRLCADEQFWGGITLEESIPIAQELERTECVDFINVTVGTYYNLHMVMPSQFIPFGCNVEVVEKIKKGINLPVLAAYQIGFPGMAEKLIAEGKADMVGFVRALISDPDMVRKAREGRLKDIRYCVKDNKGCIGRINQSKTLGCIQNPTIGHEPLTGKDIRPPAERKKRIIVIGAGPGGMEAARVACERGHKVTLYEQAQVVGGQINLITKRPGRESMAGVIHYLKHTLDKLGASIQTGVKVTPEMIDEEQPDVVIVATGSQPIQKPHPGDYGPPQVLNGWDVIQSTYPIGEKVLFIDEDGGHHSMATVEMLAEQGKKVDLLTNDLFIGIELAPRGELYLARQRLLQKGVAFITDMEVLAIHGKQVQVRDIYTDQRRLLDDHDTVVLDVGNAADDDLYRRLKGRVKEIHRVGDCVAPRGIDMAIIEGRNVGERL